MSRDLRAFAAETAERPGAEERVMERVMASAPEALNCGALIREIPGGIPGAEQRVLARLRRTQLRDEPRWRPILVPVLSFAAAAAAAAAAIVAPQLLETEREEVTPERAPIAAAQPLAPSHFDGRGEFAEIPGLELDYQGVGEVSGTTEAPVIHWSRGTIRLEVDPDKGMELAVLTDEGTVRVLGTVFTVHRDAMGTRVEVERGRVAFDCANGATSQLTAGATGACLPTTAAGMLGRGHAQLSAGASASEILESVDAGQRMAAPGDLDWRELQALRIQALMSDRQLDAACQAARGYPDDPQDPRAAELEAILTSRWCSASSER